MRHKAIAFLAIFAIPGFVSAQGTGTLQSLIRVIGTIFGFLGSIFATLAFVIFFYGIGLFILNADDEKKREEGKQWMLWSVIALFVLVTIWGIIGVLQRTVGNTEGPGKVNIVLPRL